MNLYTITDDKAKEFVERLSKMLESEEVTAITGGDREEFFDYFEDMKKAAVKYAKIRADWEFMNRDERIGKDDLRTACHNDFMIKLTMLLRLANIQSSDRWADLQREAEEMKEARRKDLGDIACYITYLIGVSNR